MFKLDELSEQEAKLVEAFRETFVSMNQRKLKGIDGEGRRIENPDQVFSRCWIRLEVHAGHLVWNVPIGFK